MPHSSDPISMTFVKKKPKIGRIANGSKCQITTKGQNTLAMELRRHLKVEPGAVIVFEKKDDKVLIKSGKTLQGFRGYLKGKERVNFEAIRRLAKRYLGKKKGRGKEE